MAQHNHLFNPGAAVTFTAEAAVTAGQLVMITGDREVSPATAAGASAWIGSAATDAAAGEDVLVLLGGVQKLLASADITAGALVACADDGKIATVAAVGGAWAAADITNTRALVGIALTSVDVSEVTDDRIEVKLFR